jgi:CHASE3 domain sensor protein
LELLRAAQDDLIDCRKEVENKEIGREESEEIQRLERQIRSLARDKNTERDEKKILQTRLTELERINRDLQKILILVGVSAFLISILLIIILLRKMRRREKYKQG